MCGFGIRLILNFLLDRGIVLVSHPGRHRSDKTREFGDFWAGICPSRCREGSPGQGGSDVSGPVRTDTELPPGLSPRGNFGMRVRTGGWHHQVTGVLSPPCPDRICHRGVNPGSEPSAPGIPSPNPGMKPLAPVAFLALLGLALGYPDPALDRHWELWKKTYGKEYQPQVGTSWECHRGKAEGVQGVLECPGNIPGFPGVLLWGHPQWEKIRWRFQALPVPGDDPPGSSRYWDELGRDGSGGAIPGLTGSRWNSRRIRSVA